MEDWQACSRILHHILDHMGYSSFIINVRKQCNSEDGERQGVFISGSKGEGITNLLQSDIDCLYFNDEKCGLFEKDDEVAVETVDPTRYMFKVERDWSPPGHCMLVLASRPKQSKRWDIIEYSLSAIDIGLNCLRANSYLSWFAEMKTLKDIEKKPISGPSIPKIQNGIFETDNVSTFSCPCTAELDAWYTRPRHYDWPSKSLQLDVKSTPANVVPVGSKNGIFSEIEWRFCFNRAELKLMNSLNPTQTKVYVVLKMILKDHLKPANKEVTSYIMKNIVLWMCESNPSSSFTPSTLLSWIYVGLQTLTNYIESGTLPYYMIPARNLLEGKFLDDVTKTSFLEKMSKLLESGVGIVHVCKTIDIGLELYNEGKLENYGWQRNLVEINEFSNFGPLPDCVEKKFDLLRFAGIDDPELNNVLLPDYLALKSQGYTEDEIDYVCRYRIGICLDHDKAADYANMAGYVQTD